MKKLYAFLLISMAIIATCATIFILQLVPRFLFCNTSMKYTPVLEINSSTDAIVWEYNATDWYDIQLTRDCNRLTNNNTLIVGTTKIVEVTPLGEIVWQLELNTRINQGESASRGFYKAERIASC